MPICKEKFIDGKLVSRLCIEGDLFFLKNEFSRPTYELSEVSSPNLCPVYPLTTEIDEDKIKDIAKKIAEEIVSDHLHDHHHH